MTPIYLNSSPDNFSLYPSVNQQHNEDQISNIHQFLSPTSQASSSSNSLSCHLFLNSSNDQNGFFQSELPPQEYQLEGDNFGSQTYGDHKVENNDGRGCSNSGLKFSLWKTEVDNTTNDDQNQVKWMSSKMRVMLKMKKSDSPEIKNSTTAITKAVKLEDRQDHKLPSSPDNSSNSTSSNNNTNMPIRVCSDCNTTKTPLWRSGPRGPKSLCNACGIRQRKARRAMAAAAAAAENGGNNATIDHSIVAPLKVTKTQQKDLKRQNNGHVAKYKKRQFSKQIIAAPSPSSSSSTRKNCVEEFLVSLSKNLEFHCVFPQDEKEAAILLMALSCGYVHQQPA